jgi:deazaflavin-dependent oxidoreductase (nitroreductase family)
MADTNDWNQKIIEEFRANEGKVGGQFEGAPVLLLTSTGAKSGRRHTTPMMYLQGDNGVYVFASKAGAPTNPDWFHNLVANPTVTVELGTDQYDATAAPLEGAERDRV